MRVHEIARVMGTESRVVLRTMQAMGTTVKSPSSTVEPQFAQTFIYIWHGRI